jgi:signal transduction histidine kinase
MQQFAGISLKTRLYLLVLAAFIPVTALIFYIAEEQKAMETQAILQKTMALVRTTADEENQRLESTRNLLTTMAEAFVLVADQANHLSSALTGILERSQGYAEIGIADIAGHLIAGTDHSKSVWNYSGRDWFQACLQGRGAAMGPYRGEHIDGKPVLYFALPALDDKGQIKAVVFAALDLNWLNRTMLKGIAELPRGSRLTLLDKTQGTLRYNAANGRWTVPQNFNPALRRQITAGRSGTLSAADEDHVLRIFAFAPLTSSFRSRQISVVLEVPQKLALADSNRNFERNVALLVVSALIAVVSIWWAGNVFILRRVRAMVDASRRLASGDLDVRIGKFGVRDELSHLAGVFDEMAAALQARIEREEQVMGSLQQSREQLRKLAAHQQEVREQERIRIAREIHDQFGQSLTILKMDLSWLKKHMVDDLPGLDEKMIAMDQVIDEALKNLHAVTSELRPVILDDFGLAAAIEWQVEEFGNRTGITCRMTQSGFEPNLPKDLATALFRIFQEILTNIMRHAQADRVEVGLAERDGILVLDVQDNGRGITEAEIKDSKSYGLLGMRERLYPWNGQVTFEGRPGRGTLVSVHLPRTPKGEPQ